jgi:hypothetical protein
MKKVQRGEDSRDKAGEQPQGPAPWIASMHDHFQRTGCYRADDLNRLLGDPRDSVAVNADAQVQVHSLASK